MSASSRRLKAAEAELHAAREEHAFQNASRWAAVAAIEEVRAAMGRLATGEVRTVHLTDVQNVLHVLEITMREKEWVSPAARFAAGRKAAEQAQAPEHHHEPGSDQ